MRRLTIWTSLGLICLAAVASLLLMQGFEQQLRDVSNTYAVRTAARELGHALTQAEANQRGFLLTADAQFLGPYQQAASSIDSRLEKLLAMTAHDPQQSAKVQSIIGDVSGKMAEMARAVDLVANQRPEEAQSLTETGMGARLMAEVSQTLEGFIAEEDQKLASRNQEIDRTRPNLVIALLAALIAAVILAYALLTRTQRQVSALTLCHRGLLSQNEALEVEIAERTRDIEEARAHAERERERVEALLQDTSHQIGNSLATVSSLLALQMLRTQSNEVRNALEAARLRVHAIASAHRRLRLGDDVETASAEEFLSAVIEDIANTQVVGSGIQLVSDIEPVEVSSRDATTLGILVGELVTNALKHAFPERHEGMIRARLYRNAEGVPVLSVSDNGVGMAGDLDKDNGLGLVIVRQLAGQFDGEPRYSRSSEGGLEVTVDLPGLVKSNPLQQET